LVAYRSTVQKEEHRRNHFAIDDVGRQETGVRRQESGERRTALTAWVRGSRLRPATTSRVRYAVVKVHDPNGGFRVSRLGLRVDGDGTASYPATRNPKLQTRNASEIWWRRPGSNR